MRGWRTLTLKSSSVMRLSTLMAIARMSENNVVVSDAKPEERE